MSNNNEEFNDKLLYRYLWCLILGKNGDSYNNEFFNSRLYKDFIKPNYNYQKEGFGFFSISGCTDALSLAIQSNAVPQAILDEIREWSISNL